MRRSTFFLGAAAVIAAASLDAFAGQRGGGGSRGQTQQRVQAQQRGQTQQGGRGQQAGQDRSAVAVANGAVDARRIWEEEKLARDVYAQLARTSGLMIFRNISRSENQHMQAIARTMQTRAAAGNRLTDTPGVFSFPDYQRLYQTLVAEGSRGPIEALMVGARIEEMDIADLRRMTGAAPDPRTRQTLQRLLRGSENHLRAFNSQITAQGGTYQAQYLSQQEYDQIAKGQPAGQGRGAGKARGGSGQGQGPGAGQGQGPGAGQGQGPGARQGNGSGQGSAAPQRRRQGRGGRGGRGGR